MNVDDVGCRFVEIQARPRASCAAASFNAMLLWPNTASASYSTSNRSACPGEDSNGKHRPRIGFADFFQGFWFYP
jgi:hypothetical protein